MSAEEDDTFDIDIYGDDEQPAPEAEYSEQQDDQQIDFDDTNGDHYGLDGAHDENGANQAQDTIEPDDVNEQPSIASDSKQDTQSQMDSKPMASETSSSQPQQGTKRKAPLEELDRGGRSQHDSSTPASFVDPFATSVLKLTELNWWTTEEDLRNFCRLAEVEDSIRDVAFLEHKINGKSRGEAYIELNSAGAASKVKKEVEKANQASETAAPGKRVVLGVQFSREGNPLSSKNGAMNNSGATKSGGHYGSGGRGGREGAYERNSYGGGSNRGGRGGWNQNRGGAGFNSNSGMYNNRMNQQQQNQGGWNGAGGGMMNAGGMGGFAPNPMMMNMFQNMGRAA